MTLQRVTRDDFIKINHDVYGNPRYYLPAYLITDSERKVVGLYKYRGKAYGKGYTIQSYNLDATVQYINDKLTTV